VVNRQSPARAITQLEQDSSSVLQKHHFDVHSPKKNPSQVKPSQASQLQCQIMPMQAKCHAKSDVQMPPLLRLRSIAQRAALFPQCLVTSGQTSPSCSQDAADRAINQCSMRRFRSATSSSCQFEQHKLCQVAASSKHKGALHTRRQVALDVGVSMTHRRQLSRTLATPALTAGIRFNARSPSLSTHKAHMPNQVRSRDHRAVELFAAKSGASPSPCPRRFELNLHPRPFAKRCRTQS
jgi:hypothetical protein